MIAMAIETHAGGRFLLGTQRYQQFKFQRLFQLAHRGQSAGSPEERVTGGSDTMVEAELFRYPLPQQEPSTPKIQHLLGSSKTDELAHPERLEPSYLAG